jgi:hypothetical protein
MTEEEYNEKISHLIEARKEKLVDINTRIKSKINELYIHQVIKDEIEANLRSKANHFKNEETDKIRELKKIYDEQFELEELRTDELRIAFLIELEESQNHFIELREEYADFVILSYRGAGLIGQEHPASPDLLITRSIQENINTGNKESADTLLQNIARSPNSTAMVIPENINIERAMLSGIVFYPDDNFPEGNCG